jgi:branched-chain amino acid transport system substrate-binding protein
MEVLLKHWPLILAAGIAGTATMDLLAFLAYKIGFLSGPVKPSLIGRWIIAMSRGRFRHQTIANYPAQPHEFAVGLVSHYSIGMALAVFYVLFAGWSGFKIASVKNAVLYGFLTNVLPWFVLFPSYGFGFFGFKGKGLLRSSMFNHINYGMGLGVLFALIAFATAGTAFGKDAKPKFQGAPLNVYVPGSHTVNMPFVAADYLAGVKFFVDEQNAKGGVLGRELKVIVQDDQADVVKAAANAEVSLKDPNHFVTIGHNFSRLALPIGKLYAEQKKLFMTPYATSTEISKIGGTVFQLCYNDEFQGRTLAQVAVGRLKAKRIVVLTNQSDPYSDGLSGHFMANVQRMAGEGKVAIEQINYVASMMKPLEILEKVQAFKADLVFLPEQKVPAAELIRVFQGSPLNNLPFLGGDGWGSEEANIGMYFPTQRPHDAAPYYYTYHWVSRLDTPFNKALLPRLKKAMAPSRPFGPGVLSIEGLTQLVEVAERLKTVDNVKLAEALRGSEFEGTTGKIRFDASGATIRNLVLVQLTDVGLAVDSVVSPEAVTVTQAK